MSKIPGFRSGKQWKKNIAIIGYIFIALIIIGILNSGNTEKSTTGQAVTDTTNKTAQLEAMKEAEKISDSDKELLKKSYSAFDSQQRTQFAAIEEKYNKLTDTEKEEFKVDFERLSKEKVEYLAKVAEEEKKQAEAKAYQDWVKNQFSVWDGSHTVLVKMLKENLNDPKSFQHVETTCKDNGDHLIVKMTYRAKNAFGGLILQNITAKADYKTNMVSVISQND